MNTLNKTKPRHPHRKISETFLRFAEPLLAPLGPNISEAQMEQPLTIAWTVWNAVVYADAAQNTRFLDQVRASQNKTPEVEGLITAMIDRKRSLFGDDHRLIGDYSLFRQDGDTRLRAEARDPGRGS